MSQDYIDRLVRAYPSISEVWLIGSRANGRARDTSDWDYMVFADEDLVPSLRADTSFTAPNIDLLIVNPDRVRFRKPWPEPEGHHKRGWLDESENGWRWTTTSQGRAHYRGCEGVDISNPDTWKDDDDPPSTAILVYRRAAT